MSTRGTLGLMTTAPFREPTSKSIDEIIIAETSASPEELPSREEPDHVRHEERHEDSLRERHPRRRFETFKPRLDVRQAEDRQHEHAVADVAEHRVLAVVDQQLQPASALQHVDDDEEGDEDEDGQTASLEKPRKG